MTRVLEADTAAEQISYTRGRDWFDPQKNAHASATLIGCGGIGSMAAMALAKLGIPKLTLVDPDVIEPHNIPNQMFGLEQVNSHKVTALSEALSHYSPTEFTEIPDPFQSVNQFHGPVIAGLDSMEARKELWETKVKMKIGIPLFMDARLGGENIVIYAGGPLDMEFHKFYEDTLYTDSEAKENICTAQSIIDIGFMVGALITRQLRNYYAGENVHRSITLTSDLTIYKEG